MNISVTEPITRAIDRTGLLLFRPFDIGKWFVLGFVCWLAHMGEGGGNYNFPSGDSGSGGGGPDEAEAMLILVIAAVVLVVLFVLFIVFMWLTSRGKLMFTDALATGRIEVKRPWKEWGPLAGSVFRLRLMWFAGFAATFVVFGGAMGWVFWNMNAGTPSRAAIIALLVMSLVVVAVALVYALAEALIQDFVITAVYVHRVPAREAWQRVRTDVLRGNVGSVVLFYLMKFLVGICVAILAFAVTCLTLCLAALPYLNSVFLLPLFVFGRCYTLYFVEQFGWRIFGDSSNPHELAGVFE